MCQHVLAQTSKVSVTKNSVRFYNWQSDTIDAKVYLLDASEKIVISGSFYKEANDLIFLPAFPLVHNVDYVLVSKDVEKHFSLPTSTTELPKVTAVYPSAATLPENLLRMYIQFSQPMKTVGNLKHIKLINEKGEEVKGAIFNNVYELWNEAQTQLTIIFDPARVKTGLIANETLGRALTPHKTFRLVVSDLEDIYGKKIESTYLKTFAVLPADLEPPNATLWEIAAPLKESKKPLKIDFFNTVDQMSLHTRIQVFTTENRLIEGKVQVENQEKTWSFTPNSYWEKGEYVIKVNSRLADPSGNNLNGLFDHAMGSLKSNREDNIITLHFVVD